MAWSNWWYSCESVAHGRELSMVQALPVPRPHCTCCQVANHILH